MKSAAPPRFEPSLVGSLVSVMLVSMMLTACATPRVLTRTARMIIEAAWLYVWSTRG